MRSSHIALLLTTTLAFACDGGGGDANNANNTGGGVQACPFTFPEPTETFAPAASPALLTFGVFPDVDVTEVNVDGKGVQYTAEVLHPVANSTISPSILYIQNLLGPSILFTPDEIEAEVTRLENNAVTLFRATTSNTTITLGGQEVDVLVAKSDIDIIMTIFVPIDGGDFIVPVSLGVYAATVGCGATLEETFEDLKASVSQIGRASCRERV